MQTIFISSKMDKVFELPRQDETEFNKEPIVTVCMVQKNNKNKKAGTTIVPAIKLGVLNIILPFIHFDIYD